MIVVHDTFVCKPGNASKLAKMFKETMGGGDKKGSQNVTVMTDMTGQYHRVIMVGQHASLAAFEAEMKKWEKPTKEMKKQMEGYSDIQQMYTSGSREIFRVW